MRKPIPFGRHLLLERINVGGMAEVFRAKSFGVEGFERIVAVKRILPQMAEDEEFIKMFIDEARIASQLTHQSIVQIYELGKHEDQYFISMEYIAGRDLRLMLDRFKRQRKLMAPQMACHLISRVAEALEYAHRKKSPTGKPLKIIHRDVSPQNVIISYEGEVKLCDFGIAKAVTQSTRTQAGVLKGKFAYMSPEQVRGQSIDHRSDLFALGVIFFEMLTGERLFLGESDFSTLEAVRSARIPSPSRYNETLPKALEKIVMKMLAKDRRRRYQWASEIHADLHQFLAQSGQSYHAQHLRQFVQETYARDIELENSKLESFMEVGRPESRRRHDSDFSDPGLSPFARVSSGGSLQAHELRGPSHVRNDDAHLLEAPSSYDSHQGTQKSPSLDPGQGGVGANNLSEPPLVQPAGEGMATDDMAASVRPTIQVDPLDEAAAVSVEIVDDGRTLASDEGGPPADGDRLHAEIQAAQAELIERLEAEGALDEVSEGETIDADSVAPDPPAMPQVFAPDGALGTLVDPSELDPDELFTAGGDTIATDGMSADDDDEEDTTSELDEPMDFVGVARQHSSSTLGNGVNLDEPLVSASPPDAPSGRRIQERQRDATRLPPRAASRSRPLASSAVSPTGPIREVTPRAHSFRPNARAASVVREIQQSPSWSPERAPQPQESTDVPTLPTPPRSLADPKVLVGLAAAVGMMALVLLAVLLVSRRPTGASLSLKTEPVQAVTVKLDGKLIADRTPVDLEALTLGNHEIELFAEGYEPYRQKFQIVEARPHTLTIPLEPATTPTPVLATSAPPDAGAAPAEPPPPPEAPAPKARAPGPTAAAAQRNLRDSTPTPALVKPSAWSIKVVSEPSGAAVTIDGRLAGTTPVTHGGLSASHHALVVVELAGYQPFRRRVGPPRVGFRALVQADLEPTEPPEPEVAPPPPPRTRRPPPREAPQVDDAETYDEYYDEDEEEDEEPPEPADELEVAPRTARRPPPPPPPSRQPPPAAGADEGGFLLISTSPGGVAVQIDGKDTGLKTPIRKPHPLSGGVHTVTLTTAEGKTYDFEVTISPGGTTKLVKRLR